MSDDCKRILVMLVVLASVAASAARGTDAVPSEDVETQLKEVNTRFTYKGEAIHPLAVQDLMASDGDMHPGPVAIELEGTYHSNRYFGKYKREKDGSITIETTQNAPGLLEGERYYFRYKHLGTLANGYHVLQTWDYGGGGTGVFTNLLLVKFTIDFEYTEGDAHRSRLLMLRMAELGLGDRYNGEIKVEPHAITIGSWNRPGDSVAEPSRVIKFD